MLDLIFSIKFIHLLAVAVMFGGWLTLAAFMLLAHRSGNTSVVALTSRFVVRVETVAVAGAVALQPLSGIALAWAIGISPFDELWLVVSMLLYAVVVACWLVALRIEMRIRDLTRQAALNNVPLDAAYRRLFGAWRMLAGPILIGMVAIFALMTWQPQFG